MNNQFGIQDPKLGDFFIRYNGSKTLLKKVGDNYVIPKVGDFYTDCGEAGKRSLADFEGHYLFNIDGVAYFLDDSLKSCASDGDGAENAEPNGIAAACGSAVPSGIAAACGSATPDGFEYMGNRSFRTMDDVTQRLGGATAAHLAHWESLHKFCGRCGNVTIRGDKERSIICPKCGNIVYPRISPVVIVAVSNGNKLLMAHNKDNPNPRRFLISGFVEIGESLEQAAHREVLEEAGVKIKNVKYFGSQPWPFSDSLIAGFTAELDGDDTIHMQEEELSEALWVERKDIPEYETDVSISCCLIEDFRKK